MKGSTMAKRLEEKRPGDLPTHEEDPLLTTGEVARQINKSEQTIRNWIMDGLLKAIRTPGGLFNIRKSEVNKLLGASALDRKIE